MLDSVWLVPLCPLVGALLNGFFGPRYSRATIGQIAIAAVGLAFLVSLLALIALLSRAEPHYQAVLFPWIAAGAYSAHVGFLIDGLSCTMMLVVTGVGLLIHIYSTGYMHDEADYARYFTYLNLFVGAMLILVMADNYLLMFVGWEGVGLCSYLLIGFWYTRQSAADAGKKAFIVNRIGDFGFMLAILLLFVTFQTTDMLSVQEQLKDFALGSGVVTAMALLGVSAHEVDIRGIEVEGGRVRVRMTYTSMGCPCMDMIQDDVRERLLRLPGVERVELEVVWEPWSRKHISAEGWKGLRRVGVV